MLIAAPFSSRLSRHSQGRACPKDKHWMQFGGHADGEPDLSKIALREASEESGLPEHSLPSWATSSTSTSIPTDSASRNCEASRSGLMGITLGLTIAAGRRQKH
jgi:hypothetical protein